MTLKVPLSSFLNQGLKPLGNDSFGSVLWTFNLQNQFTGLSVVKYFLCLLMKENHQLSSYASLVFRKFMYCPKD